MRIFTNINIFFIYSTNDRMGTNCEFHPEPDTSNICNVNVGDYTPEIMPNFCTDAGLAGEIHRLQFCYKMSDADEWGDPEQINDGCSYNDCNAYQTFGFGCCKGCCGIVGAAMKCKRRSFTGDPVTCCFNDYKCTAGGENSTCWSDPDRNNTCPNGIGKDSDGNDIPDYRSIVSSDCRDILSQYCTGTLPSDDPNSTEWINRWTINNGGDGSCTYAIIRNMFNIGGENHCWSVPPIQTTDICGIGLPGITGPIDSDGYFWAQNVISGAMERYTDQGFIIGALPGFPGYNPFQDWLSGAICCPFPGICQDGLGKACSTYTAQRISLDPSIASWCGCHLPTGEYEDYSVKFNIPPQCTPMCNRSGTIPIIGINAQPVKCEQDICLIDDVTVNLIQSQIGGGIDFDQICANCGDAQCSCIVSNTTVDINNSTIGGNVVPVGEGCGSISCTQSNPGIIGPSVIPVNCGATGSVNPYDQYEAEVAAETARAQKTSLIWTIALVGLGLLIIFLIILFLHPNLYPSNGTTIQRKTKPSNQFTQSPQQYNSINNRDVNIGSFYSSPQQFDSINNRGLNTINPRSFSPSFQQYNSINDQNVTLRSFSSLSQQFNSINDR